MIGVTLGQLANVLNGELCGSDALIEDVTTDTRKLTPGCLFVCKAYSKQSVKLI